MKIAVLSLAMTPNYGGILQAYALQKALKSLGHDVFLIDTDKIKEEPSFLQYCIRIFKKVALGKKIFVFHEKKHNRVIKYTTLNTSKFVEKHIQRRLITEFSDISPNEFNCFIVGSDQVWRPSFFEGSFCTSIDNAFLSFTEGWNVKRIAYAVSFGTDKWEYTKRQEENCKKYISEFDAISVRESSGVDLCLKHFGVASELVTDPTLLLEKEDYNQLVDEAIEGNNLLHCYILDNTPEKHLIAEKIAKRLNLRIINSRNPHLGDDHAKPQKRVQPSLESWIKATRDASFIITDSFHACVFCILYHKPFCVIRNEYRGSARIESLLRTYNLEDRIIDRITDVENDILFHPIDYTEVDKIRVECKRRSLSFLENHLNRSV